eukprot:1159175-Pelagomonas_calceolata.AAC.6
MLRLQQVTSTVDLAISYHSGPTAGQDQFEWFPPKIRILVAAAAAAGDAACADPDADALQSLLLEWRGLEEACPCRASSSLPAASAAVPAAAAAAQGLRAWEEHTPLSPSHPTSNPQAVNTLSSRAHACNMKGGVTWRMPQWVLELHWLRLRHLIKGLELELGAWEAIFSTCPFQPQN